METIICDKIIRIIKSKKVLEKKLNLKINIDGTQISVEGKPEDEYLGEKVIRAIDFGFPFANALSIYEDLNLFETVKIKDHTYRKDFKTIRARIIGKEGKTLKVLTSLTNCSFELNGNEVGIIGSPENMEPAKKALISLIQGSKQANVYNYLEKHHPAPIEDLGLKNEKDKENL